MLATYIPDQVNAIYGGLIITGYHEGTRINVTAPKDDWSVLEGTDLTSRSLMRSGVYVVTITLQQTALANNTLSFLSNQDIATGTGTQPFTLNDSLGTTKLFSKAAFIRKKPDGDFAEEVSPREWVIVCTGVTGEIVGSNVTV